MWFVNKLIFNDYSYINSIQNNDVLFIKLDDIDVTRSRTANLAYAGYISLGERVFAEQRKIEGGYSSLLKDKVVVDQISSEIEQLNRSLNPWEQIKDFRILPADLAIDSGELTPSMKVKREVVGSRYNSLVEEMYTNK